MVTRMVGAAALVATAAILAGAQQAAAYQVQAGDTLWSIAQRTGVPVDRIAQDNGIGDRDRILAGQQLAIGGGAAAAPAAPAPTAGRTYTVRPHDTLWSIARRTGVDVGALARRNHLDDPDQLPAGRVLQLDDPPPAAAGPAPVLVSAPGPAPQAVRGAAARQLLLAAAQEFGVDRDLVLALSLWESGHNQSMVSVDGAIGLMQVMPQTAGWAGPALLGRPADILQASDNARLGTALLRRYLQEFSDPKLALAAYYQGERGTRDHGVYPTSRRYVDGIWSLRNLLHAGDV